MMSAGCRIVGGVDREGELAGEGWTRRSIAALTRLEELTALYGSLGFEIRLEPLDLSAPDQQCASCAPDLVDCRAVYTRPASRVPPATSGFRRDA